MTTNTSAESVIPWSNTAMQPSPRRQGDGSNINGALDKRYIHGMIHSMVCAVVDERLRGLIELAENKTIDATVLDEFLNSLKVKECDDG